MADKLRGRAKLPSVSMRRESSTARPDASSDDQSQVERLLAVRCSPQPALQPEAWGQRRSQHGGSREQRGWKAGREPARRMVLCLASALEEDRLTAVIATVTTASGAKREISHPQWQGQVSAQDERMNRSKAGSIKSDGRCDFSKNTS